MSSLTKKGKCTMILGPMFAGKTTELMRQFPIYRIQGVKGAVIKYDRDQRYDAGKAIVSHDQVRYEATFCVNLLAHLLKDLKELNAFDHLFIEEGHFFKDLVEFCEDQLDRGIDITIVALDGTWEREPFENVARMIAKSDHLIRLHARCNSCSDAAPFTRRLTDSKELEVIGGSEMYAASCRSCFTKSTAEFMTSYVSHMPHKTITPCTHEVLTAKSSVADIMSV